MSEPSTSGWKKLIILNDLLTSSPILWEFFLRLYVAISEGKDYIAHK